MTESWNPYMLKKLKIKSHNIIVNCKGIINFQPSLIADIGANTGFFSQGLLQEFKEAEIHSFEPHPHHIKLLNEIKSKRLKIHPYGLSNVNEEIDIGMVKKGNYGTYSPFGNHSIVRVHFKDIKEETISPDLAKIDIEGSEAKILKDPHFYRNTKAIIIEIIDKDPFNQNIEVKTLLKNMGFKYNSNISKNDQLWLR